MGAFDWSCRPADNGVIDPTVPATDSLPARQFGQAFRGIMSGVAALADDQGGASVTAGTGNSYAVHTACGARLALLVEIDRANIGPAFQSVDGLAPRPWRNREGLPIETGQLRKDDYLWAITDSERNAWISDLFGRLTVALFDAVMRVH